MPLPNLLSLPYLSFSLATGFRSAVVRYAPTAVLPTLPMPLLLAFNLESHNLDLVLELLMLYIEIEMLIALQ